MTGSQKAFYISCINNAIDYIENNINTVLKLDNIAKAVGLSTFHFHRIFKSFMNESLNNFVRRVRVEKAAIMLFNKLYTWAGPRNLLTKDTNYYCIYYDEPEVTDESKLRIDVCMNVPEDTEVSGEIGKQAIKGGQYAVARCVIKDPKEYEKYWSDLYKNWLPSSGYQPDAKPPFEMYSSDCKKENDEMIVDICMPVIPV